MPAKSFKYEFYLIPSHSDFVCLTQGSLRQKQVCDALRCFGLHARCNDALNGFITLPEKGWGICNLHRDGDRLLQLSIFKDEFLVTTSHELVLTTSVPFVHTARRSYRLSGSVNYSEIDLFSFVEHAFRSLLNRTTWRKVKS